MTAPDHLRLLDTEAAGELLGLSKRAMEERRRRGDGPPYVRLSATCVRYRMADLVTWLEERTFSSTSEEAAGEVGR
jgi:predicted DNA-binding transcriptional regulator AlpA